MLRRVAAVFVLALGVAASQPPARAVAAPVPWSSSAGFCPKVVVIGARGTGQSSSTYLGLGPEVYGFADQLTRLMGGIKRSVGVWANPYPAVPLSQFALGSPNLFESVDRGRDNVRVMVAATANKCGAGTQIVVAGYSQGAWVARDGTAFVRAQDQARIGALVLIADPHYDPRSGGQRIGNPGPKGGVGGSFAPPGWVQGRTTHVCIPHDLVCQSPTLGDFVNNLVRYSGTTVHTQGYGSAAIQAATAAAVRRTLGGNPDINGDGIVSVLDLSILLSVYGTSRDARADLDGDGLVTAHDLSILLSNYGHAIATPTAVAQLTGVREFARRASVAGPTQRVTDGSALSGDPMISANGRYVAFVSEAADLVPDDTNGVADALVLDRETGSIERVSVSDDGGEQADAPSFHPQISADGRYVAFDTEANLDGSDLDTNGIRDVYVRDRQLNRTWIVSVSWSPSAGSQTDGASYATGISLDGATIVFYSSATNLVSGDTNGVEDVFVRAAGAAPIRKASLSTTGGNANAPSVDGSVSANGRFVAFTSRATNLVDGDGNGHADAFVRDLTTGTTERVSVTAAGGEAGGPSNSATISADGRYVAFDSDAANIVAGDTNAARDVFVRDLTADTTSRASVNDAGQQGDRDSIEPTFSADGEWVAFRSSARNLAPQDTNDSEDVFRHVNAPGGRTERVSLDGQGGQATGYSFRISVSEDGRLVTYASEAADLVPGDSSTSQDVFLADRAVPYNMRPPAVHGSLREGQTLTADPGAWTNTDTAHARYRWQRCPADGFADDCVDIAGAHAKAYGPLRPADVAARLRVIVTAPGSPGDTTAASETTEVILPKPPANTGAPAIAGAAVAGRTLTVSTGVWRSSAPLRYAYRWQRCASSCTSIAGATSARYAVQARDVGFRLRVVVTATNAGGTADAAATTSRVARATRAKLVSRTLRVSANGIVTARLSCVGPTRCRGRARLFLRRAKIADARLRIGEGKTRTIRLKLTRRGLRTIGNRRRVKGQLVITLSGAAGKTTIRRAVTLRG